MYHFLRYVSNEMITKTNYWQLRLRKCHFFLTSIFDSQVGSSGLVGLTGDISLVWHLWHFTIYELFEKLIIINGVYFEKGVSGETNQHQKQDGLLRQWMYLPYLYLAFPQSSFPAERACNFVGLACCRLQSTRFQARSTKKTLQYACHVLLRCPHKHMVTDRYYLLTFL